MWNNSDRDKFDEMWIVWKNSPSFVAAAVGPGGCFSNKEERGNFHATSRIYNVRYAKGNPERWWWGRSLSYRYILSLILKIALSKFPSLENCFWDTFEQLFWFNKFYDVFPKWYNEVLLYKKSFAEIREIQVPKYALSSRKSKFSAKEINSRQILELAWWKRVSEKAKNPILEKYLLFVLSVWAWNTNLNQPLFLGKRKST